jgi:hypothetical protein
MFSRNESELIFSATSAAHRCANTIASSSELLASLLAPCNPVHAHSPQAYKFRIDVLPHSSVLMPHNCNEQLAQRESVVWIHQCRSIYTSHKIRKMFYEFIHRYMPYIKKDMFCTGNLHSLSIALATMSRGARSFLDHTSP